MWLKVDHPLVNYVSAMRESADLSLRVEELKSAA
jgi:hypothetical protein